MKVTIENIKGLNKDLKVLIDKETMNSYMDEKYEEIKGTVNLKGFRPGKVPREVLKRQFGKAIFGEVLDKVLKETSTKALEENKIKPAGQPKLDLKTYGEDKELEYVLSITELPKVDIKSLESIKFDQYSVKIDDSETDKRIKDIAKNQPSFKEASPDTKAKEGDLVALDYKATIDGKEFKGNEGKNTQLTLGKDLFLKGFDKQLNGVKKNDEKIVEAILPENFPEKELVNKKALFNCKILNVKNPEEVKIDASPPILWKKEVALLPTREKAGFMSDLLSSSIVSTTNLKRLLFNPPHRPLSEEIIIYPFFLTSLVAKNSEVYSGCA